jgi:hypothetical protein
MDFHSPRGWLLWPLPLAAGVVPALAAVAALWLSFSLGLLPPCNPLLDGCASISRAARHDLANHVFRALVLPGAVLQSLVWVICASWLRRAGSESRTLLRALQPLGMLAGIFLILYGTFLGTEGDAYRWMRRYGVILYFGFTYLCMLIAAGALWQLALAGKWRVPGRLERWLLGCCAVTLIVGLAQPFVPPLLDNPELKNRLENILEWYVGLLFTLYFVALACLWRRARVALRLES